MRSLSRVRVALWVIVGIAGSLLGALAMGWWQVDGPGAAAPPAVTDVPTLGGAFTMTDHRGRTFTLESLGGRPTVMFFGFTACPEVCPTTLNDISGWLAELGPDADRLNAVFVSVDPERDGVEQLAGYLTAFDPRIVGLTGTPDQLRAMADGYRFFYEKVDVEGGGYTMNHTASVYLLDSTGALTGTVDYHEARDVAVQKVRRLLLSDRN